MNKLVINTATDELFMAILCGDEIFSHSINSKMHHNETMLSEIDKMLSTHGLELKDVDELGVVIGPGSFTGIRVGIATIKAFRDALNIKAKGINNLEYLYKLSKAQNNSIETVAIAGSKDSYFVARNIHETTYIYERNLTEQELKSISKSQWIGMFKQDENLNCFVVKQDAKILLECLKDSTDEILTPVYYQLSQAENEKLKRASLQISVASVEDLKNIANIEKDNILTNTMSENQIKNALKNENYIVLKAEIENETVGFIMLQITDELNIDSLAVKKDFRNFGVATKLIQEAQNIAKEKGIKALSLEVAYKNITAFLLYEKLGFSARRTRKNYYSNGDDCIEMFKML